MKNIPKAIYLQIGEIYDDVDLDCLEDDFFDCEEVTWHHERINDSDIEYQLVEKEANE